jgi:chromosome partitioning protein
LIGAVFGRGTRPAAQLADLVVIPTRPSPHDLRAVGRTVELVQTADKAFAFAVTQAKPNARLTVQAMAALSEHGVVAPSIVHDRVDYAGSMIDGRTVQETDPKGRSAAEMAELWKFVKAQMAKSTFPHSAEGGACVIGRPQTSPMRSHRRANVCGAMH